MENQDIKIMIVDDEELITEMSAKILKRKGFSVFTAMDGATAIETFQRERPDINLIDVHLGDSDIDGVGVLESIRKEDSAAICVMVTRITDKETVEKIEQLGVKDYLYKPLDTNAWLEYVLGVADEIKGIAHGK